MNGSLEPVVDFSALPRAALERLAGHYGVEAPRGCELPELATAVRDAFAREAVDEEQVMLSLLQRERREAKRSSTEYSQKRAREMTAKTTARSSHGGTYRSIEATPRKKARGMTYGDMISSALRQLPGRRGTLEQIYGVMEKKFGAQLNMELEAGPRQVPVWKASVRKIINLNGVRFHRSSTDAGGHSIFELSKGDV